MPEPQEEMHAKGLHWGWVVLAGLACLLPLLATPVLPLVDFYAHIVRFVILADPAASEAIAQNYEPAWRLLPNLGLDVIGTWVMMVMPPLEGARMIAALLILAPFLGTVALARAVQGKVRPVHLALAGLVAHSMILGWGFANFLLGMGLSLAALALWIALAHRPALQLLLGVACGIPIMLVHGLAFALWGLMLAAVETMVQMRRSGASLVGVVLRLSRLAAVAAPPVLIFLQSRTAEAEGGVTKSFSNLANHASQGSMWPRIEREIWDRVDGILRVSETAWPGADRAFGLAVWALLIVALWRGALRLDRRMLLAIGLVAALVVVIPPSLFGVGHVSERMPLLMLCLLGAAISVGKSGLWVERGLVGLFLVHLGMLGAGWLSAGQVYRDYLAKIQTLTLEGPATAAYDPGIVDRDGSRFCKPLLFLLMTERGLAVPTFANVSQQPLDIIGPLRTAIDAASALPPDDMLERQIPALMEAGFSSVVACTRPGQAPLAPVAEGEGWAIYGKQD